MTKRKGKTKMKTYQVNDVVQFMGDEYKVVEVLQMEDALHIKKTSAPFNSMVVPKVKLANGKYENMSEGSEPTVEEGEYFEQLLDAAFENMAKEVTTQEETDAEIQDILDFSVKPDLMYRPDNKFSL